MIPKRRSILKEGNTVFVYPSYTYSLDRENERILGHADGLEAVAQTVVMAITTEAYKYPIFPNGFGIETRDLYGKHPNYVKVKIQSRVEQALAGDDRILGMEDFKFEQIGGDCHVSFTVLTVYGETEIDEIIQILEA